MFGPIEFLTAKPTVDELLGFYRRQNHKTTHAREKLQRMIDMTACFSTARAQGELIGLARGVTDGVSGRLAECKLDPQYQGPACVTRKEGRIEHDSEGIAREMARLVIEALRRQGAERIDAVAYGTEVDFCEELGFKKMRGVVALELGTDTPVAADAPASATSLS